MSAIIRADALALPLGDATVDLVVTSPPYLGLRSYQDGGEHYDGQIGSEDTPTAFLDALWAVTAECWRVLKPSGSLFVNLGDKYASGGRSTYDTDDRNAGRGGGRAADGARPKTLLGLPWRYAIGCIDGHADPEGKGWILRSEIVWSKPNGLPESVRDRVRRSHEQWFHMTKEPRYFCDIDPIREAHADVSLARSQRARLAPDLSQVGVGSPNTLDPEQACNPLGKLPDSVWTIPTQPLIVPESLGVDHFAAFPTEWPRRIITAWSPSGICTACGEGRRTTTTTTTTKLTGGADRVSSVPGQPDGRVGARKANTHEIIGEACACPDTSAPTRPAVVLDPFGGTGTTAMVAKALGRFGVSVDLSADYLRLANWRINESDHVARVQAKQAGRTYRPAKPEADGQASIFDLEAS